MPRHDIKNLQDIPNIGKAIEAELNFIGINKPHDLVGKDPYQLYNDLCETTGRRQDPCVLDVFISAVRYMEGGPPKKWWEFTSERKKKMGSKSQ